MPYHLFTLVLSFIVRFSRRPRPSVSVARADHRLSRTLLCLIISLPIPAVASETIWMSYPEEGIELGQGFDLLNNRKTPAVCVDFIAVQDAGLETTYELSALNSFSDVLSALNVSASGALDMSIFTARAKLQFANKVKTALFDQKYAISARIHRGILYASPTTPLKPGATTLSKQHPDTNADRIGEITFRRTNADDPLDFVRRCGHGFVSAIALGVEIDTIIDTSAATSEEVSSLSGSAKLEVLGGLISGSGSLSGTAEAKSALEQSRLTSFILGGEQYNLPRTIAELKDFIRNLPNLSQEKPRGLKIAVSSYSTLVRDRHPPVLGTAAQLQPLVFAYFSARDAKDRLSEVLDGRYRNEPLRTRQRFVIPREATLYGRFQSAVALMRELRDRISTCRLAVTSATRPEPRKSTASLKDLYLAYADSKANLLTELRAKIREGSQPVDDGCTIGKSVEAAVALANDLYLFALASVPVDLDSIHDEFVSTSQLRDNIRILAHQDWDDPDPSAVSKKATIRRNYAKCVNEVTTRFSLQSRLRDSKSVAPTANGPSTDKCRDETTKELSSLPNQSPKQRHRDAVVRDVLTRELYRKAVYPALKSLCGGESHYSLCLLDYHAAIAAIGNYLHLDRGDYEQMAQLLELTADADAPERVDEPNKKLPVWPDEPGCSWPSTGTCR